MKITIYRDITAQNSCALKPKKIYIIQREKMKDFHDLAEFTFRRRARLWKPSTLRVNRDYLKNQILPYFKSRAIALPLTNRCCLPLVRVITTS